MLVKIEDIKTIKGKRLADKYKLEERRVYFESTGHFPRPVLLDSNNHIIDGYTSYAVAKEKGFTEIECTYDLSVYGYNRNKRTRTEFNSSYSWELKGFHDAVDIFMETDIEVPIDLRKYNSLVKNMVHRYIDDVFFKNC